MLELLIFMIASIGMAHILVDGSIFTPFKNFLADDKFYFKWIRNKILTAMNCYQCSGFWSGAFVGTLMWLYGMLPPNISWLHVPIIFVYACAASYLSTKAAVVIMWMQKPGEQSE